LWQGSRDTLRSSVFLPYIEIQRAVRDERWKLIAYTRAGHLQLFDLQTDPHEQNNLIDVPEYAPHIRRLLALMKEWQAKTGDTLDVPSATKPFERIDLTGRERVPDEWQPEWIRKKYF